MLKADLIQQHKYRTFQQLIGRLPPPADTSAHQVIPGCLYIDPSPYPPPVNAAAQQVLAGKQMDSTQDWGRASERLMQGTPSDPEVTTDLTKRDLSLQIEGRMPWCFWLEISLTEGHWCSCGLYVESSRGCAEAIKPISPGMSPGIQALVREQK